MVDALITYNLVNLHNILSSMQLANRRLIPNYETICSVKSLRINKHRIRLSNQETIRNRKINLNNLKEIQSNADRPDLSSKMLNVGNVNAQLIKNKLEIVLGTLIREILDLLLITEIYHLV